MSIKTSIPDLPTLISRRFEQSISVSEAFFTREAEQIARACWAVARRFHQGGRLLAFGNGACATDAQHVAVEFVHPVIVGKRALPALALTNDSAALSTLAAGDGTRQLFIRQIEALARPQDVALGFSLDGRCENIVVALEAAKHRGLLTLGLAGCEADLFRQAELAFCFVVPARDPLVIQETHETLYHILWELVHIFFEHEGLLASEADGINIDA
jgi:D-sedoheptulose 7-phosphate isomerase